LLLTFPAGYGWQPGDSDRQAPVGRPPTVLGGTTGCLPCTWRWRDRVQLERATGILSLAVLPWHEIDRERLSLEIAIPDGLHNAGLLPRAGLPHILRDARPVFPTVAIRALGV